MSYNNQPEWETYKPTIKDCEPKKNKLKIVIKKKPKLVIKKKPTFKEEFNKWNDFNTEWLKEYNLDKLVEMFNGKNIPEMEEITKKICNEINEKQIESNILKTNNWCKILLTMEEEEQNKTSLSIYKIVKQYDNKIRKIKKDIQKAVDTNMEAH